jgi:GNAT superfamily N-acetyltransferase
MTIRSARESDAEQLFEVRRAAILAFAAPAMPREHATAWAEAHPTRWMVQVIRERDVWVLEIASAIAGWISTRANKIDGLYTSPPHAGQGIGSRLLVFVERELQRRGHSEVVLDASVNAEGFYVGHGYAPCGPRLTDAESYGAQPMRKQLCE